MELTTSIEEGNYLIVLNGDLDASSSLLLDQALENAIRNPKKQIWVDCGGLNYISSAGLGVFISHIQNLRMGNISLILCNVSPKIKNVFSILGLDSLIPIMEAKAEPSGISRSA